MNSIRRDLDLLKKWTLTYVGESKKEQAFWEDVGKCRGATQQQYKLTTRNLHYRVVLTDFGDESANPLVYACDHKAPNPELNRILRLHAPRQSADGGIYTEAPDRSIKLWTGGMLHAGWHWRGLDIEPPGVGKIIAIEVDPHKEYAIADRERERDARRKEHQERLDYEDHERFIRDQYNDGKRRKDEAGRRGEQAQSTYDNATRHLGRDPPRYWLSNSNNNGFNPKLIRPVRRVPTGPPGSDGSNFVLSTPTPAKSPNKRKTVHFEKDEKTASTSRINDNDVDQEASRETKRPEQRREGEQKADNEKAHDGESNAMVPGRLKKRSRITYMDFPTYNRLVDASEDSFRFFCVFLIGYIVGKL